jgi:hypothetical protein
VRREGQGPGEVEMYCLRQDHGHGGLNTLGRNTFRLESDHGLVATWVL